jgi:hypothetical protein
MAATFDVIEDAFNRGVGLTLTHEQVRDVMAEYGEEPEPGDEICYGSCGCCDAWRPLLEKLLCAVMGVEDSGIDEPEDADAVVDDAIMDVADMRRTMKRLRKKLNKPE